MLFSIIVPIYQVEKFLPECLRSIEAQQYTNYEVVLIDDGSSDGSGTLCDRFAEKYRNRVQVIHKKNEGLLSARRVGIQAARGQYAVFLDSDDLLDSYCLSTLKDKIEKYGYPDIVLYQLFYYSNGRLAPDPCPFSRNDEMYSGKKKCVLYNQMIGSTSLNSLVKKAIKLELLKSDPTDYSQYYGKDMTEDLLQSLWPMTHAEQILLTNEPLYYYRCNADSISRNLRLADLHKKNDVHVYQKILEYLPQWGVDTEEARDLLHAHWIQSAVNKMVRYFRGAKGWRGRVAVLQYPWYIFVDETRPIPLNLKAETVRIWDLYCKGRLYKLLCELSCRRNNTDKKSWKRRQD